MSEAPRWIMLLYRSALRALPSAFRQQYGDELEAVLRARWSAAPRRRSAVFVREVIDVVRTAFSLRYRAYTNRIASEGRNGGNMRDNLRTWYQAARGLRRQPGYVAAVVLTLAMGLGSATTAFHVADALLLQDLPHPGGDELVMVWQQVPAAGMTRAPMSYPTFHDLSRAETGLAALAVMAGGSSAVFTSGREPERVNGVRVSGNLFELLGNQALLGRTLNARDTLPGAEPVAVVAYDVWQRQFDGSDRILDRAVTIRQVPHRIVGVMPREFVFPSPRAQYWVPLKVADAPRDMNFLTPIGRLAAGITREEAERRIGAVYRHLTTLYPDDYQSDRITVESRQDYLIGDSARVLQLVGLTAGLLLLLTIANVVNLMLVRAAARGRDFAVRAALGAGRTHLLSAQLAETGVLTMGGIACGIALAHVLTGAVTLLGADALPRRAEIGLDTRAVGFAISAGISAALACALIPLWRALRGVRTNLLERGTRVTASLGERRLQGTLVVAQVGLAFALLVGGGLLTHSLYRLLAVPVGFAGERALTARLSLPPHQYDSKERIALFYDGLLNALRDDADVEHAGAIWALPFSPDYASSHYTTAGRVTRAEDAPAVFETGVRGDYFAAAGMTLLRGRTFGPGDVADAPPVVIVNQTLARRFWPDRDPIGMTLHDPKTGESEATVIGVVNDVRRRELAADVEPEMYWPHEQALWNGDMYVVARTKSEPLTFAQSFREHVWTLDPDLPVEQLTTLQQRVSGSVAAPRFRTFVVVSLSVVAALLALLGLYATLAYTVATRTRDIAIRMALGARQSTVLRATLQRGLWLTAAGLLAGSALALPVVRLAHAVSFGLPALDLPVLLSVALGFLLMALAAAYVPAARAARVDPLRALQLD